MTTSRLEVDSGSPGNQLLPTRVAVGPRSPQEWRAEVRKQGVVITCLSAATTSGYAATVEWKGARYWRCRITETER